MNAQEIVRLIAYLAGVAAGLFALAVGIIERDWELITLGGSLMGISGLAGVNVPSVTKARHGEQ